MTQSFGSYMWQKVAADLAELDGWHLLIVVEYFSNFIEVVWLTSTLTKPIVGKWKEIFAQFGVPDTLVTDNELQIASPQFASFADTWD